MVSDHPPNGPGWARGDQSGLSESSPLKEARGLRSPSGLGALEEELLLHRLRQCTPRSGGPWQPEIRWLFAKMRRVGLTRRFEDRFACSLLRTWELLRPALVQAQPSSIEEVLRQPLVWSPLVRTARGHLVGSRPHVSWGAMAGGPARTFEDWQQFQRLPKPLQAERTVGMRGSALMIADISEAIPAEWTQPAQLHAPS